MLVLSVLCLLPISFVYIGDDDTVSIHSWFQPEKPRGFEEGSYLPWMSESVLLLFL